jgi:ParB/RepB/Spo0J family partition protein
MPATAKRKPRKTPDSITAKQGSIPPGLTSTVTPGGIAAHDPDAIPSGSETICVDLPPDLDTEIEFRLSRQGTRFRITIVTVSTLISTDEYELSSPADDGCFESRGAAVMDAVDDVRKLCHEDSPENAEKFAAALRSWLMQWEEEQERAPIKKPKPSLAPIEAIDGQEVREILVGSCHPHPLNPRPTAAEVAEIQQSFVDEEQLEPIDVRIKADGRFEILSGETRWRAAAALNWRMIKARVRTCDDATAVKYLALFNAKRKVLDPIRKAQMIAHLTTSRADGGAGMTLAEAGQVYGIASAGGASNLKRLLQLPAVWQERVISGELPESFARLLLPYCHAARLMAAIEADYQQARKSKHDYDREPWESRSALEERLGHLVAEQTRPIEPGDEHYFHLGDYHYSGRHPLRFELTPDVEQTLAIETFERSALLSQGKQQGTLRRATNIAAYDKLQLPAIKRYVDGKAKQQAAKAGAKADRDAAAKKPLTKAEEQAKAKKQADQLAARVQVWRHKLLRHMLIDYLDNGHESGFRVFLAVACHRPNAVSLADMLAEACNSKRKRRYGITWGEVEAIEDNRQDGFDEQFVVIEVAKRLLAHESTNAKFPTLPFDFVESYAAACKFTMQECWDWIQLQQPKSPLFEEFFLFHSSAQLDALAAEFGVYFQGGAKQKSKARMLAGHSLLPLPKSLPRLAGESAAKRPAKKRGAK